MCKLCDGTHVVYSANGSRTVFCNCPTCGPMPVNEFKKQMDELQARLDEFEKQMRKEAS